MLDDRQIDDPAPPGAPATFRAIRSARAFEEIAAQIRNELAEGRLRVGSRLPSERALSEQFGVSRNTLREALRSLEHAGLIRLQKGASGGAFISERSGEAIITGLLDMYHLGAIAPAQLTEARIWLESIIVREACARTTPADLAELEANIEAADRAGKDGDFAARAEKHLDFHRILARMTGNPIMVTVMNGVLGRARALRPADRRLRERLRAAVAAALHEAHGCTRRGGGGRRDAGQPQAPAAQLPVAGRGGGQAVRGRRRAGACTGRAQEGADHREAGGPLTGRGFEAMH